MSVSGVVFDVGNVIVRWDPRTLYSKIFPDTAERDWFLANVCTMAWHMRHDAGVSFAQNRAPLVAAFPEHEAAIVAWEARWWEMFSGPIPETEAAIEAMAARGVAMVGLTNMSTETSEGTFAMSPAFGRLRDVVVSGAVGLMKPDPRIFLLAAERAGLPPADLLFVDDSPSNIDAAAALGFDVHLFADPAALQPALAARGLL
ncbi:MAG TPA: HAD family phosphatase [Caulobacteraceae bacterium]|nr:HAD family phosphatase [Caulobacteraceae bacterium]